MTEADVVAATTRPGTTASLARNLAALGLKPGMLVLVHASLSALGWVAGGPVAVIQALTDVLTPAGTLVMPAFSSALSDPATWRDPPVPAGWWPTIRAATPAFDPATTPTRRMGSVAETFRTWPGVVRSNHPNCSFAAWGRRATAMTADHGLDFPFGDASPLGRLYAGDGWVLLLGVGFANNTSFHLAENRAPDPVTVIEGAPILQDGARVWATYRNVTINETPFTAIGAAYEATGAVCTGAMRIGAVGAATARLFVQAPAVDFATDWLTRSP